MKLPEDLDNSRLETYNECAMKYRNHYVLNLETPKHLNTRFSSWLIHLPITELYKNGLGWEPTEKEWTSWLKEIAITPEEANVKTNAVYSIENAKRILAFYRERFASDFDRFEFLGVEDYLLDETIHPTISFGSKPDIRAKEKATGLLWTLEIKFSDWDFILEGAPMNPQFLGQVSTTKGHGVIVTLIQPSGAKWGNFGAVREEIVPKASELNQWRSETSFKMDQVRKSHLNDVWPRSTPGACSNYGGCFFLGLCVAGHPPEMLARMPRVGDPLSYLGKLELSEGNNVS